MQDWSYYFDGSGYLEIPLNIDPSTLPSVTIGAWVKPASQDDTLPLARYACPSVFIVMHVKCWCLKYYLTNVLLNCTALCVLCCVLYCTVWI